MDPPKEKTNQAKADSQETVRAKTARKQFRLERKDDRGAEYDNFSLRHQEDVLLYAQMHGGSFPSSEVSLWNAFVPPRLLTEDTANDGEKPDFGVPNFIERFWKSHWQLDKPTNSGFWLDKKVAKHVLTLRRMTLLAK